MDFLLPAGLERPGFAMVRLGQHRIGRQLVDEFVHFGGLDGDDPRLLADIIQNDVPQSGTPPEISVVDGGVDVIVPVIQLSREYGAVDGASVPDIE